jgi:hypothetical protein
MKLKADANREEVGGTSWQGIRWKQILHRFICWKNRKSNFSGCLQNPTLSFKKQLSAKSELTRSAWAEHTVSPWQGFPGRFRLLLSLHWIRRGPRRQQWKLQRRQSDVRDRCSCQSQKLRRVSGHLGRSRLSGSGYNFGSCRIALYHLRRTFKRTDNRNTMHLLLP